MTEPSLADANEPLVLANGMKINPLTGRVIVGERSTAPEGFVEVPSASEAIKKITRVRKQLSDLPAPPKQMNAISVIAMYTMLGLSDDDISVATDIPVEQIGRIKMMEAYVTVVDTVVGSVLEHDTDDVRQILQQGAKKAARNLVSFVDDPGALGLAAVNSVLDRTGHRPADIVEHRHSQNSAIRIEYVRKEQIDVNLTVNPGDD